MVTALTKYTLALVDINWLILGLIAGPVDLPHKLWDLRK